ncbi:MAG: hypothetical protein DCC75_05605, partial [Proteobacteria bacterium]
MPSQIRNLKRKLSGFAVITLLSCALAALSFHLAWFPDLEGATWDWRTRYIARRAQPDPNIKIIAVDQHSLDFYAAAEDSVMLWPWPRSIYGAIVEYLRMAGARGVAFDILFSEQSFSGVEEDQQFADSIAGAMPVVQAVALQSSKARNAEDPRLELLRARQLESERSTNFVSRLLNSGDLPEYLSAVMPVRPLLEKSHAFGSVTSSAGQESGELFRFAELGGALNGIPILSLPFALYNGAVPREQQRFNPADFVTGDGRLILRFFGPTGSIKTYSSVAIIQSYANILEEQAPAVPLAEFKNALVFVGLTAPGLMDIRPTALSSNFPGVEVNATALDNIQHQRFIRMLPDALELLGIALFVSALSALSIFVVSLRNQVVLITSVLVIFALAAFKAADLGYWVPIVPFILGMLFSILSSQAFMYQLEGKQHRFIKDAFKFYVSPAVIDKIIEEPELLALGGERRELSMFFSDIAGFTSISESIEASKLVPLINRFLSAMTQVIQKTGGTVDKYVGDAIVAFWN